MINTIDTRAEIISAPPSLTNPKELSFAVSGTVVTFVNGMVIVKVKDGEAILRLKEGMHISPGRKVFMKPEKNGTAVRLTTDRTKLSQQQKAPLHPIEDIKGVPPIKAGTYRSEPTPQDKIIGHTASANAVADATFNNGSRPDMFNFARAMCLMPDFDQDTMMIELITFLLVNFGRGDASTWIGLPAGGRSDVWDQVLKETLVSVPGMATWKVRQFPIYRKGDALWALFAIPAEDSNPVGRFILEIPTANLGLIQLKGFGAQDAFEIILSSTTKIEKEVSDAVHKAVQETATMIGAHVRFSCKENQEMIVDLSHARRTALEI